MFLDSICELFVDFRLPCIIYIAFCKHEYDVLKLKDNKKFSCVSAIIIAINK